MAASCRSCRLPGGQTGICTFPSGKQCEEWALMRGECTPG
ncbi:DUF333 domain-containing protein [Cupriavidus necator]